MATHKLKMVQNDTDPPVDFNVKNEDGTAKDLTGYTTRFKIVSPAGTQTNTAHETCSVIDAVAGQVRYIFAAGDIPDVGDYYCDLEVTNNSTSRVQTEYDMTKIKVRDEND